MTEYAREGAPQARVGMGIEGNAVRADHRARMGHRALNVLLVHHEIDRACGLQSIGCFLHGATHFLGDLFQVTAAHARDLVGPGYQHLVGTIQHVGAQDGRAGDIGIDVEGDLLMLHRFGELWQRLDHAAEVGAA